MRRQLSSIIGIFFNLAALLAFSDSVAQSTFAEGVLTYQADTLDRIDADHRSFVPVSMKIYKKGNLLRQEMFRVNPLNWSDTMQVTQIRNEKGLFVGVSTSSIPDKIALLTTYEEEKAEQANRKRKGYRSWYKFEETGRQTEVLGLPAEEVLVRSADTGQTLSVLRSLEIDVSVGQFFEELGQIRGTLLQFPDKSDWLVSFRAVSVKRQPLPADLFTFGPEYTILSMKQFMEIGTKKP